jgi:adenosine deaminase
MNTTNFINALEAGDINGVRKSPKVDLHCHLPLNGSKAWLEQTLQVPIPSLEEPLHSMDDMQDWVGKNLGHLFATPEQRANLIPAAFVEASLDGVVLLETGEDVWMLSEIYGGSMERLVRSLEEARKSFARDLKFSPQIGLSRHCSIEDLENRVAPFLDSDYFTSVDLYGDELAQPIENFKNIYRMAKARGLRLKAHVGEWGPADSVKRAVEELELTEVQHGISAATDRGVMNWLVDNDIQLNICPSSNLMLSRVKELLHHPIRILYDAGIKVTINTDDVLVFGKTLSEEFMQLFSCGLFTARELDAIRRVGLNARGLY